MTRTEFYRRPPVHAWQFWAVIASILVIFGFQVLARHLAGNDRTVVPLFVIVVAYALPILYAALEFGLLSTVLMAACVTGCVGFVMTNQLVQGDTLDAWAENVQVVIIDVVGAIVGHYVEVAKAARRDASRYAARVVEGQEDERRRIARELHDEPVQLLIHLARLLEAARQKAPAGSPALPGIIEAQDLARSIGTGLRTIAQGLRPSMLEDLGLEAGVARAVREFAERSGIDSSLEVLGSVRELDKAVELALFRISQEALANVAKHAGATKVQVKLVYSDEAVSLSVDDNGVGMAHPQSDGEQLGIIGMGERIRAVGGSLRISGHRGTGTTVEARVECRAPSEEGGPEADDRVELPLEQP